MDKENDGQGGVYEEEDELSVAHATDHNTPPQSSISQDDSSAKPTPYANLRQLAGLIRKPSTPGRRKSSNPFLKPRRSATPSSQRRQTPVVSRALQPITGNRSNPTTPHVVRALAQRRNTPGFERRKSGRIQRETPRDVLRNLSKALARSTERRPSPLSAPVENQGPSDDGSEDELSPAQPNLTLPIRDEDDSFDAPPPRLSLAVDEYDQTARSIELGRRESMRNRLSRGDLRASGQYSAGEASDLGLEQRQQLPEDLEEDELSGLDFANQSGDTEDLRKLMLRRSLGQATQREGDTSLQVGDDDAGSPFVLQIPDFAPRPSNATIGLPLDLPNDHSLSLVEAGGMYDEDELQSALHTSPAAAPLPLRLPIVKRLRKPRVLQKSRFGIEYPNIPPKVAKTIANTFASHATLKKTRLGKETMAAVREAGDQFLAQLGGDLRTFARHADRTNVEEVDVVTAMLRQRHVGSKATAFSLAQHYLPSDLVRELRIPMMKMLRRRRKRRRTTSADDSANEEDILSRPL